VGRVWNLKECEEEENGSAHCTQNCWWGILQVVRGEEGRERGRIERRGASDEIGQENRVGPPSGPAGINSMLHPLASPRHSKQWNRNEKRLASF
jgi:hypothetical protein